MSRVPLRYRVLHDVLQVSEHLAGWASASSVFARAQGWLEDRVRAAWGGDARGRLDALERVVGPSPSEFAEAYLRPRRPVILQGLARDWPAVGRWDPAVLGSRFPDDEVTIWEDEPIDAEGKRVTRSARLGDVGARIAAGESVNLRFDALLARHPELVEELRLDQLAPYRDPRAKEGLRDVFMGAVGTTTRVHCAIGNNLFIQIHGRKRWRLWPSSCDVAFKPPMLRAPYFISRVDPDRPDADQFPLFGGVDGFEGVLEPGDVLYVPPFYWHYVDNLTPAIGVGYRWTSLRGVLDTSVAKGLLTVLATNPSVLSVARAQRNKDFSAPFTGAAPPSRTNTKRAS